MIGVVVCIEDRFRNAVTVNFYRGCVSIDIVFKEGFFYFRD